VLATEPPLAAVQLPVPFVREAATAERSVARVPEEFKAFLERADPVG
jgi:hypothetical protein